MSSPIPVMVTVGPQGAQGPPPTVTKADIGLGNVDNTADAVKPQPLLTRFRPAVATAAPLETITCSWGLNPAYTGQQSLAWNAAGMAPIARGAVLTATGNGTGRNLISGTTDLSPYFLEFFHYGADCAIWSQPQGGFNVDWKVWVDNCPLADWAITSGATNIFLKLHFPSVKVRRIRVAMSSRAQFWGILYPSGESVWPTEPGLQIALIGDSYATGDQTGGTGEDRVNACSIPQCLSNYTGADVYIMGKGGSGYVAGAPPYGDSTRMSALAALPALDAIIVFGDANDTIASVSTAATTAAATSLYTALAAARPGVPIIVVGNESIPGQSAANLLATENAVAAAATVHPAVKGWIPMQSPTRWISGTGYQGGANGSGNSDIFVGGDITHPTRSGANYIASRVAAALAKVRA